MLIGTKDERMTFRALFVGIDRYQSPEIRDLSCAARDATALEAMFGDTLCGGKCPANG